MITAILKPEDMPVDEFGNRADLITDGASVIARMNIGRLYEHYMNSACRDTAKRVRERLGVQRKSISRDVLESYDPGLIADTYNYLTGFYELCSEKQHKFYTNLSFDDKINHLAHVVDKGVTLFMPINNSKYNLDIVRDVQKYYPPDYSCVHYTGNSKIRTTTLSKIRIAPLYIMLLEKIADSWLSVSSGRLHPLGILSPIIKSEKFSFPFRQTPVRTLGETEVRILVCHAGQKVISEMMDISNNPMTQKHVSMNILSAPNPTNISSVVDRGYIPLGCSKPLNLIQHAFFCNGFKMSYVPESKYW